MGPKVTMSMLGGAVLAFGVLGPWAVSQGLAPDHMGGNDGSKAWLTWISLAIMIADSLTSLAILIGKYAWTAGRQSLRSRQAYQAFSGSEGMRCAESTDTSNPACMHCACSARTAELPSRITVSS